MRSIAADSIDWAGAGGLAGPRLDGDSGAAMSEFEFEAVETASALAAQERQRAARAAVGLAVTALQSARALITDPHERARVDQSLALLAELQPLQPDSVRRTPRQ